MDLSLTTSPHVCGRLIIYILYSKVAALQVDSSVRVQKPSPATQPVPAAFSDGRLSLTTRMEGASAPLRGWMATNDFPVWLLHSVYLFAN